MAKNHRVIELEEVVVKFAGDSGDGMQLTGTQFSDTAAFIGNDLSIGRFAMVGMGSLITKDVDDFHLVIGHPAKPVGCVCRCGHLVLRFNEIEGPVADVKCPACGLPYGIDGQTVVELDPPT